MATRAALTATASHPGITLIFTRRYPCSSAAYTRRVSVSGFPSSGMPSATPQATLAAGVTPSWAAIRPPEMMNGSMSGIVSSNSSARTMRMAREVEEMQRPVASLELTRGFELEHCGDEAVAWMKHQRVQRPLGARAPGRGVLGQRQLEKRVQLHALAAAPGVVHDQATGADVSGAA